MAGLRLDCSFSVHFGRGRVSEQGFDNSSFEVWWYKTRSQRSVDDCREENVKVFVQQFCRNGIKIA